MKGTLGVVFEPTEGPSQSVRLALEDRSVDLKPGQTVLWKAAIGTQVLQMVAVGEPGSEFVLKVASPNRTKWEKRFRIPRDGIVAFAKKVAVSKGDTGGDDWPGPRLY